MARDAPLIEVGCGGAALGKLALPTASDAIMPFLHAVKVQTVSYGAALAKGTYID